jgi:hypothetical protein
MSTARCASINSLMRWKIRRCESREKSSASSFSAASAWAALSSRMAPRMVFSASMLAGSPVSKARSGTVAISEEFRTLSSAKLKKVLTALEANWQAEMEGYHTYLALADRDTDPVRAQVLRHLAGAEWEHAALWHGRIEELGGTEPGSTMAAPAARRTGWPTAPARPEDPGWASGGTGDGASVTIALANRAGGPGMALRRLEIDESRAIANYGEPN